MNPKNFLGFVCASALSSSEYSKKSQRTVMIPSVSFFMLLNRGKGT